MRPGVWDTGLISVLMRPLSTQPRLNCRPEPGNLCWVMGSEAQAKGPAPGAVVPRVPGLEPPAPLWPPGRVLSPGISALMPEQHSGQTEDPLWPHVHLTVPQGCGQVPLRLCALHTLPCATGRWAGRTQPDSPSPAHPHVPS